MILSYISLEQRNLPHLQKHRKKSSGNMHAMEEELKSIMDNNTWVLVDLPAGPIDLKWVDKLKKNHIVERLRST